VQKRYPVLRSPMNALIIAASEEWMSTGLTRLGVFVRPACPSRTRCSTLTVLLSADTYSTRRPSPSPTARPLPARRA
jgi:hypothetical protein